MNRDSRETQQASRTSTTLLQLKNQLAEVASRIVGLEGIIARNKATPPSSPLEETQRRRVVHAHERCLLHRMRLQAQISALESGSEAAFAMAFLETAQAELPAYEFKRIAHLARDYIDQELCA